MTAIVILAVLAVMTPCMMLAAYRQGLGDGQRMNQKETVAPVRRRKVKPNAELKRWAQIESNIQVYNGSSQGQRRVK